MKKMLFAFGFIFYSLVLRAQIDLGFRAGIALSTIENNALYLQLNELPESRQQLLYAPNFALSLNVSVSAHWSLQTEINYLSKGSRIREEVYTPNVPPNGGLVTLETRYAVQYLELPLLVKYHVLEEQSWTPVLLSGLSVGYALSQKMEGDNVYLYDGQDVRLVAADGSKISWDQPFWPDKAFNRWELSAVAGIAIDYQLGKQKLNLDIRYLHDFTNWLEDKLSDKKQEVRHRNILISTGINF